MSKQTELFMEMSLSIGEIGFGTPHGVAEKKGGSMCHGQIDHPLGRA